MKAAPGVVVHLIEDDPDQRSGLASLLRGRGLHVVEHASAGVFLTELDRRLGERCCILTDIRLPGMSGLELQATLKDRGVTVPIVLMSGFADVSLAVSAMRNGAVDFVEKPFDAQRIVDATFRAIAASDGANGHSDAASRVARLTDRERQILRLLLGGGSNKAMAQELGLSVRTVEEYRASMMRKLGADSVSDAVRLGIDAGMLRPLGGLRGS